MVLMANVSFVCVHASSRPLSGEPARKLRGRKPVSKWIIGACDRDEERMGDAAPLSRPRAMQRLPRIQREALLELLQAIEFALPASWACSDAIWMARRRAPDLDVSQRSARRSSRWTGSRSSEYVDRTMTLAIRRVWPYSGATQVGRASLSVPAGPGAVRHRVRLFEHLGTVIRIPDVPRLEPADGPARHRWTRGTAPSDPAPVRIQSETRENPADHITSQK